MRQRLASIREKDSIIDMNLITEIRRDNVKVERLPILI